MKHLVPVIDRDKRGRKARYFDVNDSEIIGPSKAISEENGRQKMVDLLPRDPCKQLCLYGCFSKPPDVGLDVGR